MVRAGDPAARARGAARRGHLHRRQQRAGDVRALAAEDFVVTGYVPDVTPYFTGCRVSIAPLRYGAGVKGKINLAMSYGLPVVATTPSIEGMSLVPGDDVLVADDARDFADAIVRLYHDEALWNRLAAGGRENIRTLLLARCRAQHDHAVDRIRAHQRKQFIEGSFAGPALASRRRSLAHEDRISTA